EHEQQKDELPTTQLQRTDLRRDGLAQTRQRHAVREDIGSKDDRHDRATHANRAAEYLEQHLAIHVTPDPTDAHREYTTQGSRLGGRRQPQIKGAEYYRDQHHERQQVINDLHHSAMLDVGIRGGHTT